MTTDNTDREELEPIYVASRASIPERGEMWREFRSSGVPITSSWIDEDGDGATADFGDLWLRIADEIRRASALVLYAVLEDFPLKGALTEAGIALGMGKPVIVCLPDAGVLPRNYRPIGSWIAHPLVTRCDDINAAVRLATRSRAAVAAPQGDAELWRTISGAVYSHCKDVQLPRGIHGLIDDLAAIFRSPVAPSLIPEPCGYCASPDHFSAAAALRSLEGLPDVEGLWHRSSGGGYYRCTAVTPATATSAEQFKPMCDDPNCWVCNRMAELHAASSEYGWSKQHNTAATSGAREAAAEEICAYFGDPELAMGGHVNANGIAAIISRYFPSAVPVEEQKVPGWSVEHPDREREYWANLGKED